jgi:TM2 domain-containing membrane protein YozV
MKKNLLFGFLLSLTFFCGQTFAQKSIQRDSLFLAHLLENDLQKDALLLMSRLSDSLTIRLDLAFQRGFAHYNLKQLDSSVFYLASVPRLSKNFIKAKYFEGLSYSYLGNYQSAKKTFDLGKSEIFRKNGLNTLSQNDSLLLAVHNFELSGLALLERKIPRFDSLKNDFSVQFYAIQKQQEFFKSYEQNILSQNNKSAFKAALFSAILPGSGKVYAGQLGQGIAAFLQNAVFGFQAYEGYRKDGLLSARTIIYGGLFTLFYVGNIWGSALSIKVKRQEFNDKTDDQIRFDMHIPLRTIFNK